jgi:hypothetical protein
MIARPSTTPPGGLFSSLSSEEGISAAKFFILRLVDVTLMGEGRH